MSSMEPAISTHMPAGFKPSILNSVMSFGCLSLCFKVVPILTKPAMTRVAYLYACTMRPDMCLDCAQTHTDVHLLCVSDLQKGFAGMILQSSGLCVLGGATAMPTKGRYRARLAVPDRVRLPCAACSGVRLRLDALSAGTELAALLPEKAI